MKVTVCFDNVRVVVPCGDGALLVRDLMREAIMRYRKATGKCDSPSISSLSTLTGGGILDPDDRLCDVADDREQILAHFGNEINHAGGDGASSVGTNSPDFFHIETKERRYANDHCRSTRFNLAGNIKRESTKRLSMHALSTREPHLTAYSALSLPRESRRREPLGQDAKGHNEPLTLDRCDRVTNDSTDIREIVIKNETGPLGLHVVPCYDLAGCDQGLRVEGIEPHGRIAKDGQIDLHDRIVRINGHNLLRIPFTKVQTIFASCMSDPCLRVSVIKNDRLRERTRDDDRDNGNGDKTIGDETRDRKVDQDDSVKKLQCNNILQSSNTRKIGRMIEIDLTKGTNGLGFSVTTRDNPAGGHCPIYIKNILPKGAAVEDGRLRPGDRLLEVNKMEMTGKSQSEVVSLLRSIPAGGKVRMIVSRQEEIIASNESNGNLPLSPSSETSPDNVVTWSNAKVTSAASITATTVQSLRRRSDVKTYDGNDAKNDRYEKTLPYKLGEANDDVVQSPRKNRIVMTLDIPVNDTEKAGLGVSVKGKTSSADDNTNVDLGIFIKSVLNGGAASRDGRLRTNDQLLNVNGVSLLGLSNSDAMETLRRAMLNTNSAITGVITLTIARRVSSTAHESDKSFADSTTTPSGKIESNSLYTGSMLKKDVGRVREMNNLNSQNDNDCVKLLSVVNSSSSTTTPISASTSSPWNPVIDRLTEQYNKNSLRNESYCLATNKTWLNSVSNVKKLMLSADKSNGGDTLHEESNDHNRNDGRYKSADDRDSQYSGDPTYDSQLSLEEANLGVKKFSRDALGRQSMSEKRHAALDAKNTDTYKRNKKLRDTRDTKSADSGDTATDLNADENAARHGKMAAHEITEQNGGRAADTGATCDDNGTMRNEKKHDRPINDYSYTIGGACNNKFTSPRKHWLVDDDNSDITGTTSHNNEERDAGFTNVRGDVKQASLNSALDDRYKRSRKKGGIRSMLRLGKNRKSLNFGDNIDNRHEPGNYCSGTINYIA